MRQAEIQIGGVYVSKGIGMKRGELVKVVRIIPQSEGPARVEVQRASGKGRTTRPLVTSFRGNYDVKSLPHPVTANLMGVKRGGKAASPGEAPAPEEPTVIYHKEFNRDEVLEKLYLALSAALDAVGELRRLQR